MKPDLKLKAWFAAGGAVSPEVLGGGTGIPMAKGGLSKIPAAAAKASEKAARQRAVTMAREMAKENFVKPSQEKDFVYHGTNKDIKKFRPTLTPDDHVPGISVTSDPFEASSYAKERAKIRSGGEGANVLPLLVRTEKPMPYPELEAWALNKAKEKGFRIEDESDFAAFDVPPETLLQWLKEEGYDAIDYRDDPMLGYGLRVFEPTQLKSAIGNRTYDPNNPEIDKAKGGAVDNKLKEWYASTGGMASKRAADVQSFQQGKLGADELTKYFPGMTAVQIEAQLKPQEMKAGGEVKMAPGGEIESMMQALDPNREAGSDPRLEAAGVIGKSLAKSLVSPFVGIYGTLKSGKYGTQEGIRAGERAIEEFMAPGQISPEATPYVQDVGKFLEELETKYKIPPLLPEAMPLAGVRGVKPQVQGMVTGATDRLKELPPLPVGLSIEPVGTPITQAIQPKGKPEVIKAPANNLGLYSPAEKAILNMQRKQGSGEAFLSELKKAGVSNDELEFTKLDDFLKGKKNVTRDELQEFMDRNRLEFDEIEYKQGEYSSDEASFGRGEVVDDDDWIMSEAEYIAESFDDYLPGRREEIKDELLNKYNLTEEDLADPNEAAFIENKLNEKIRDIAQEEATTRYYENPYMTWSNGLGYSIDGNDDVGYSITTPSGRRLGDSIRDFETAEGMVREDAINSGLVDTGETRFHDYQLDGGKNYRELLLISPQRANAYLTEKEVKRLRELNNQYANSKEMPPDINAEYMDLTARRMNVNRAESFDESHWDEPNVLLHMRVQDRTTADGKPMLYVDEMQSDWHQRGNEQGYFDKESRAKRGEITAEESRLRDEFYAAQQKLDDYANQKRNEINLRLTVETNRPPSMIEIKEVLDQDPTFNRLATDKNNARIALEDMRGKYLAFDDLIADAPYKDNWHELGVKRILAYAAENGYDRVGFSAASPQIKRWGTQEIAWEKIPKGNMSKEGFLEWAHNKFATTPDEALNADWDNKGTLYRAYKELTDLPPAWRVAANEQRGGIAGRINLEAEARSRGILKTNRSDQVTSEAELRRIVDSSVRGLSEAQIDRITKKTWDRMQKQDAGVTAPREEGMKFFYDNKLKKFAEKYAKKMGGEFYEAETKTGRGVTEGGGYADVTEPVYVIELTPKLKDSAMKGQAYKKGGLVTQRKGWKLKHTRACKDFKAQKFARGGAVRMQAGGNPLDRIRQQLAAGVPIHVVPGPEGDMARQILAEENQVREAQERAKAERVANLPFMDKVRGGVEAARTVQSIVGQEISKPFVGLFGGKEKIAELEEGTPLPETEAGIRYLQNVGEFLSPVAKVIEQSKIPDVPFLPELGPVTYIPGIGRQVSGAAARAAKKVDEAVPEGMKNIPVGGSTVPAPGTPPVAQAISGKTKAPADELGFYSPAEKAAVNLQRKSGTGQAFLNDIAKQGVKKDELESTGLAEWLKSKPAVTKDEIVDYIHNNRIQIKEVMRSKVVPEEDVIKMQEIERAISKGYYDIPQEDLDWFEATKQKYLANPPPNFDNPEYNLPGGSNYRELLLTFPINQVRGDPYHIVRDEVLNPALKRVLGNTNAENALRRYQLLKNNPTWENDPDRLVAEDAIRKLEQSGEGDALNKYFASFDVDEQRRAAKENAYKSPHWEEPNVFAHIRMQDKDIDGKKTLVIEEIQSDWHQVGREKGYKRPEDFKVVKNRSGNFSVIKKSDESTLQFPNGKVTFDSMEEAEEAIRSGAAFTTNEASNMVPNAPFKEDWYQVALKRAVKYAADNDYDAVAIVGGKEQANRYALSRKVDAIGVEKTDGGRNINIQTKGGGTLALVVDDNGMVVSSSQKHFDRAVGKPITDVVGKSMGKKLMEMDQGVISGQGLNIGGEGMAKYYDEIYPKFLEKQYKKYGVKPNQKGLTFEKYTDDDVTMEPSGEADRYGREVMGYTVRDRESGEVVGYGNSFEEALREANSAKTDIWLMDIPANLKSDVKIGQSYKKGGLVKDKKLQEWHMAKGGVAGKVAKAAEKAGKRMSRAEAEAAGLWHQISETKLPKPIGEYKATVIEDPSAQMLPKKTITPEELQGGVAIPLAGDRAAAGRIIQEIEGTPMNVTLEGGPDFMRLHPGAAWASGKGVLSMLADRIRMARESGQPIYGVYTAMSPLAVDFNTMMTESLLNQLDISGLRKKDIQAFDEAVKKVKGQGGKPKAPNFPGLDDPKLREKLLSGPGGQRDAFVKTMAKAGFQKKGFPDVAAARLAVTEPELLDIERGSAGYTIAKLDPEGRIVEQSGHSTYPLDILGEYAGGLEKQLPVEVMYPTHFEAKRLMGSKPEGAHKSLELFAPLQYLDQGWLDNAMQYLEMQKKLTGRKKGGLARAKA